MSAVTKEIVVPPDHKITVEVELPADWPAGRSATIVIQPPDDPEKSPIASLRGRGKGQFTMLPDFDAPLDDFAEYM